MKTIHRICIEDFTLKAENAELNLERGKEYLTSTKDENDEVTVLSNFWAKVPARIFAGAKVFTP